MATDGVADVADDGPAAEIKRLSRTVRLLHGEIDAAERRAADAENENLALHSELADWVDKCRLLEQRLEIRDACCR